MSDRESKMYEKILESINKYNCQLVCDYGCGDGELLDYLKDKKPDLELYGIDYFSKWKDEGGAENYVKIDREGEYFTKLAGLRMFDMVVSTHALHHFQYPVSELRTIAGMIRPGGLLDLYDHCFDHGSQRGYVRSLSSLIGEATSALRGMYHRHHYSLEEAVDLLSVISGEMLVHEEFRLDVSEEESEQSAKRNLERIQGMIDKITPKWPEFWLDIFLPLLELDYRTIEKTGMDTSLMLHIIVQVNE